MSVEQQVRERLSQIGVINPNVEVEDEFLVAIVLPADSKADLRSVQSALNGLEICVTRLKREGEA